MLGMKYKRVEGRPQQYEKSPIQMISGGPWGYSRYPGGLVRAWQKAFLMLLPETSFGTLLPCPENQLQSILEFQNINSFCAKFSNLSKKNREDLISSFCIQIV